MNSSQIDLFSPDELPAETVVENRSAADIADWGSLNRKYGKVLVIRFYSVGESTVAQVGDQLGVQLDHVCATYNTVSRGISTNIFLSIETTKEPHFTKIKHVVKLLAVRFSLQDRQVERFVLHMDNYSRITELDCLYEKLNFLVELNIGTSYDNTDVDCSLEVGPVTVFMHHWVSSTSRTLLCLRLYPSFTLDAATATVLVQCPQLVHLTLAKVRYNDLQWFTMDRIRSVEWDGMRLAFIDTDLCLASRMLRHFPNARSFRCHRLPYDITITLIKHLLESRDAEARPMSFDMYVTSWKLEVITQFIRKHLPEKMLQILPCPQSGVIMESLSLGSRLRMLPPTELHVNRV